MTLHQEGPPAACASVVESLRGGNAEARRQACERLVALSCKPLHNDVRLRRNRPPQ